MKLTRILYIATIALLYCTGIFAYNPTINQFNTEQSQAIMAQVVQQQQMEPFARALS